MPSLIPIEEDENGNPIDHMMSTNFMYLSELIFSDTAKELSLDNHPPIIPLLNCQRMSSMILQPIRNKIKRTVSVTSWYRGHELNDEIGGSVGSAHTKGLAVDIQIPGYSPRKIAKIIIHLELPFHQLICERFESKVAPGTWVEWVHIAIAPPGQKPAYETLAASGQRGRKATYERISIV